ncbi:MAG TPA: DUF3103 family protein [Dyella sp.]|uniref:DUF3103 family protein n=1 Tax=Dyella sp. TaxID=1869338 RepID=UPI002F93A1E5
MDIKVKTKGMALAVLLAFGLTAQAAPTPATVQEAKQQGAQQVALLLSDRIFTDALRRQLSDAEKEGGGSQEIATPLTSLLAEYRTRQGRSAVIETLRGFDTAVKALKGYPTMRAGVLQLRLYVPKGQPSPTDFGNLLVAFEPAGKSSNWTTVDAYDSEGRLHLLDARQAPDFPVLVLDIDGRQDLREGVRIMNQTLAEGGLHLSDQKSSDYELTVLTKIRLDSDKEPWLSGAAEVFAMVSGMKPNQEGPNLQIVDMPYLDWEKRDYFPGQDLIHWSDFGLGAVNIQLFEQDDDANYKALASAILDGISQVLDKFEPTYSFIPKIADAILKVTPDSWWINDNDYLDSYYLIEKGKSYVDRPGAAGNATATFTPYTIKRP